MASKGITKKKGKLKSCGDNCKTAQWKCFAKCFFKTKHGLYRNIYYIDSKITFSTEKIELL